MSATHHHVCPWWLGYLLVSPIRKWLDNPDRILRPLIRPGMRVLDFGAAMGFYSLPAARLVGEQGHVTCVDLQPRMLASVRRRAARAGLTARIDTVVSPADGLGTSDRLGASDRARPGDRLGAVNEARSYDLVLLIHVLHEVPDPGATLRELAGALAQGGRLLLIEPRGHVSRDEFDKELAIARAAGLTVREEVRVRRGFGAVLG